MRLVVELKLVELEQRQNRAITSRFHQTASTLPTHRRSQNSVEISIKQFRIEIRTSNYFQQTELRDSDFDKAGESLLLIMTIPVPCFESHFFVLISTGSFIDEPKSQVRSFTRSITSSAFLHRSSIAADSFIVRFHQLGQNHQPEHFITFGLFAQANSICPSG